MAAQVALLGGGLQLHSCSCSAITRSATTNLSNLQLQPQFQCVGLGSSRNASAGSVTVNATKKKGWFDDPFDYGPDDVEDTMGELMSQGAQGAEDPTGRPTSDNESGYLDFPEGFMPEIASLGTLIRNDVRKCLCIVSGGVYDNVLFFPVIQLLKNRFPGVKIDVMATVRGKQASLPPPFLPSLCRSPHIQLICDEYQNPRILPARLSSSGN